MTEEFKRTPEEWLEMFSITVLDADGWRCEGAPAWDEPVSYAEFRERLFMCTVDMRTTEFLD